MMKFKMFAVAAIAATMLGAGAAQAHIIEDIYTGDVNFSSTTFTAIFEYNDQIGNDGLTEVTNGSQDPTILAKVTFSDGTVYNLPTGGAGATSEYFVVPGAIISSDYTDGSGDFLQIGVLSGATPGNLASAFTDNSASLFTGSGQVDGQFLTLPASTVQVIVDPTVSAAPEPAIWALMIMGLGGIGMALRQARAKRRAKRRAMFAGALAD